MANFSAKCSIMTQEMVDSFCESFYIPAEVHPTALGRDKTIAQFPACKVGVYTRIFDVNGYRIPFTKFFMAVLKYFRVYISQLSPFGVARVSHFEVLTRVLELSPSVTVFRAFYTRTYSDGLFSFAKHSTSAPSCFPKPPDSIKNWTDHFFWVDSCIFPISVPLYTGGVLEKDLAPHLTARQEQTVKLLESHKAPFRRYPKCSLCLVDMGLLDFIKTADPRKVRAVEVQKGDDQVTLLESTRHCFMPLVIPAAGGSSSVAATEIPAPIEGGQEDVAEENAYLELADPDEGTAMARQSEEEVVTERPKKIKKKRLIRQSDVLPAKKLRTDHPSLASGTRGYYDSEGDVLYLESLLRDDNTHNLSSDVFFDHESQHIKNESNHDTLITSFPKNDPLHHEFAGEVITIPPGIVRENKDYINRISLLCGNSSSRRIHSSRSPKIHYNLEDSDSIGRDRYIF
ncbi:hypothetical protein Tco_0972436 [Tanacetum coccineum]